MQMGETARRVLPAIVVAMAGFMVPVAPARAADPLPPTLSVCMQRFHRACLTPAQVQAYYGVDGLLRSGVRGQGKTIAVIDSFGSPTLRTDLQAFDRAFGLPDPRLAILAPIGVARSKTTGWVGETTLDVEWAHVMAPAARIVVLESPVDETEGVQGLPQFLKLERYALQQHLADVISQSWGATENTLFDAPGRRIVAKLHHFFAQATARGVTVVAGSGDQGAGGIDRTLHKLFATPAVGYPASDPLVLAVGGTALSVNEAAQVQDEAGWHGSGGGTSRLFAEPAYQRSLPASVQQLLAGRRGLPDVAFNASPSSGVLIFVHGRWQTVGGTSAAAPQWAGLIALADSLAGRDLGLVTPLLYALACSPRYSADFRDITMGNSLGPVQGGAKLGGIGFRAAPGWDAVTGLGSPRTNALIPDLVRLAARHATSPTATGTGACEAR